jgi:UDP-N-acetylglucosamine 2-epimerase (non-hydrolysing)
MRIAVTIGTRPEAIKLAPVVAELRRARADWDTLLVATAQHRQLLDQALEPFGLRPDLDLDLMVPGQSLPDLTARVLAAMSTALAALRPALLVVQGDTTTVFGSALAAFFLGIPVAHVEAGLRTPDIRRPFPEEANRRLTSVLTRVHFAPTASACDRLLAEGVPRDRIAVTGNTVVDAVLRIRRSSESTDPPGDGRRRILLTSHRRENWGPRLHNICTAVRRLVETFDDIEVVYPVHLNPEVQHVVEQRLGSVPRVRLLPPLDYGTLLAELAQATLVLTDSGGIQEEAPSLGKPVLVLRETTERPEACLAGVARVVGTDVDAVVRETSRLLSDPQAYASMVPWRNPFGDGRASSRIVRALERWAAGERLLLRPDEEFDARREVDLDVLEAGAGALS